MYTTTIEDEIRRILETSLLDENWSRSELHAHLAKNLGLLSSQRDDLLVFSLKDLLPSDKLSCIKEGFEFSVKWIESTKFGRLYLVSPGKVVSEEEWKMIHNGNSVGKENIKGVLF